MNGELGEAASALPPETSGTTQRIENNGPKKAKKVRLACERCRHRRIKCDGQVPACGNCSKAGVLCVDVDGHDADRRIARGYSAANANARIAWLEDIIRTQLPHVNLDDGPFCAATTHADVPAAPSIEARPIPPEQSPLLSGPVGGNQADLTSRSVEPSCSSSVSDPRGQKRPLSNLYGPASRETSVEQDTRSVALDLGLLSLNPESRQVHYLGSSSGSLFASLLQTKNTGGSSFGNSRRDDPSTEVHGGNDGDNRIDMSQLEDVRKVVESLYEQLRKDLPSRSDCDILLRRFFQYTHANHPFLHRPSFEKVVDALYQCVSSPSETPIQYNGWPTTVQPFGYNGEEQTSRGRRLIPISAHVAAFQLFVALSIGATLQIRKRKYNHNPSTFFKSAISLSKHVFGTISMPVLQSVLLLIVHSLIDPEGCNNVWTLTHIAMAHGIDLGIHREVGDSGKFSTLAEMRRRIFFCAYSLDRSISTIQGRPLGIGDDTFDVGLPIGILSEDPGGTVLLANRADTVSMPFSIQVFKMAQHISRIKFELYRLPSRPDSVPRSSTLAETQNQIRQELDQWLAEASTAAIAFGPSDQSLSIKLKIHYHGAMCLLHQPSQAILHPNDQALQTCFESATQRLRLYEALYESGNLYHSWRTVQDVFLAGATIMYCVSISSTVRRSISLSSLARDFRSCSNLLSSGGEWWPRIRNARSSLERLASHTLELFAEKTRSGTDNLQVHNSSDINNFGGNEAFDSALIENALASVLNHDGQLGNIFDSIPMSDFIDDMPLYDQDPYAFNDSLWSNSVPSEFENVTRQSRSDDRDLQDFIDTLGNS